MTVKTRLSPQSLHPHSLRLRVASLRARKHELKARIAKELKRPLPCSATLQTLKRLRLRIKDELSRQEGLLRTLDAMPRPGKLGNPV